jgi:hypothetical protein
MGIKRKRSGPGIPRKVWNRAAMRALAVTMQGAVALRAFQRGEDVADQKFDGYSTTPIYIGGETAKRLRPSGGRPSRTGRSVFYAGGYRQYKASSTGRAFVNLTLSGQLRRSFRVKRVSAARALIGTTGQPSIYNQGVQERRPWVGISPRDRRLMVSEVSRLVRDLMNRSRK